VSFPQSYGARVVRLVTHTGYLCALVFLAAGLKK
jgi:hypothetical protein